MNSKFKPYLLIMPATFVILGIILAGMYTALSQSLGYFPAVGLNELTLKYYKEVILDESFIESFKFSIYISLVSSLVAVIIGVFLAYVISESNSKKIKGLFLYKLPIVVPHIVAALLVYNLLSQSGIFPRFLYSFGIIKEQTDFPTLVFDSKGVGIIISYLWKEIPFVTMVVYGVLSKINGNLSIAARNLGASRGQAFKYVVLPLILPTVFSSFIIIFSFSFGAYEVPFLLGSTVPKALPVAAYIEYSNPNLTNRPYAMVMNVILIFISLLLIYLYEKSFKFIYKK